MTTEKLHESMKLKYEEEVDEPSSDDINESDTAKAKLVNGCSAHRRHSIPLRNGTEGLVDYVTCSEGVSLLSGNSNDVDNETSALQHNCARKISNNVIYEEIKRLGENCSCDCEGVVCSCHRDLNKNPSGDKLNLDSLLENIPLAYDPTTKQLHLLKDESRAVDGLNEADTSPKDSSICSLSKTNASSFSSISSLSTNTDASASTYSANDFERAAAACDSTSKTSWEKSCFSGQQEHEKTKRKGFTKFLTRNLFPWKSKEVDTESTISMETNTYVVAPSANSTSTPGSNKVRVHDVVGSTTALILENRPSNLPKKSADEELKHKQQYEDIVEAARKKERKEAKRREKLHQQKLKQEVVLSNISRIWSHEILPYWQANKNIKRTKELWWNGIPPSVRGKVWKLAIGNELNVTSELYDICVNRAFDRIQFAVDGASISSEDVECIADSSSCYDKEGSVEFIKLDVSRTFPQLCIFQKSGPYHDVLHSLLGAYVCYRPDIGYVQGMSFLAAILILNMDVDDAFVCFSNLLNKQCLMSFFTLNEPVMKSYFLTYQDFFKENLPALHNHFSKHNLTPDLYLLDWIYTLFSRSLPLDVACRIWDIYFRDGEPFLFRTALGLLHLYKETLSEMEFIHIAQFLTKLPDDIAVEPLFKSIECIRMTVEKKNFDQVLSSHLANSK